MMEMEISICRNRRKLVRVIILAALFLGSCTGGRKNEFVIKCLQLGETNSMVFETDKKDSLELLSPPPEMSGTYDIGTHNFFEHNHKVYYHRYDYIRLCGILGEAHGEDSTYYSQLLELQPTDIVEVTEGNMTEITDAIIASPPREVPQFISFGIEGDVSCNSTMIRIVNKIYRNSYDRNWVVRKTQEIEIAKLNAK